MCIVSHTFRLFCKGDKLQIKEIKMRMEKVCLFLQQKRAQKDDEAQKKEERKKKYTERRNLCYNVKEIKAHICPVIALWFYEYGRLRFSLITFLFSFSREWKHTFSLNYFHYVSHIFLSNKSKKMIVCFDKNVFKVPLFSDDFR